MSTFGVPRDVTSRNRMIERVDIEYCLDFTVSCAQIHSLDPDRASRPAIFQLGKIRNKALKIKCFIQCFRGMAAIKRFPRRKRPKFIHALIHRL